MFLWVGGIAATLETHINFIENGEQGSWVTRP